jgi:hypothetical protein
VSNFNDDDMWGEVDTPDTDAATAVAGTELQAVVNDRYDQADWQDALTQPDLHAMARSIDIAHPSGEDFLRDLFWLFTKGDPTVRPAADMDPMRIPNRQVVDQFRGYPEVDNLRAHTVASPFNAVTAMLSMDTEIRKALTEVDKIRDQQSRDLAQAIADGKPEDEVAALRAATEAAGTAAAIAASRGLVAGASNVEAQITEDGELFGGFGVEGGDLQRMSFEERRQLTGRLRGNRMAKFARLIGSFKAEAQAQIRKRADSEPSEITGVELGDDLNRLTAGELANLAVPELEILFFQRYVERSLLVYEVRGNDRQGRGPMVLCVDESGSMSEQLGGVTREAWSKALSLALVAVAHRQNRGVVYVGWSSDRDGPVTTVIDLSKPDVDRVIEMTEHFFNGGTHYEQPLEMALKLATDHFDATAQGRADIIFITDDAYTSKKLDPFWVRDFNESRALASVAVHGILIGSEQSGAMAQVCDTVRPITGVIAGREIEPVANMFSELMKP